jgi:O-antigen/teichoic acid export membrane protein
LATPWIINIICGIEYEETVITLRLLLLSVFFIGANNFKIQFLLVSGRADLYAKIHILAALAGLPLLFILINSFSYLGAAIATIIIEMGIFAFTFKIAKKII